MSIVKYLEEDQISEKSLPEQLFARLLRDILTEKIRRGSRLTEKSVCETYDVSRTPVREALRQLEINGLIETVPNRGAIVIGLDPQDVRDLELIQIDLESRAAAWAVDRITDEEMSQLTETFEFMEFYTAKSDAMKMRSINAAFHRIIDSATHNRQFEQQLTMYWIYIRYCSPNADFSPNHLAVVLEEHRAIYQAFQSHDPIAGSHSMRVHLENGLRRRTAR